MRNINFRKKRIEFLFLITIFSFVLMLIPLVSSAYTSSSYSYTSPGMSSYNYLSGNGVDIYPQLDETKCGAGQDFLIQVSPLGCSPSVVRSDLLEEQDVSVFCPLMATKLNPLIDVEAITNVHFENYPNGISAIGFFPAQAALSTSYRTLLNSPVLENIGYAVINVKKQKNESSMPEYIEGEAIATIKYDITNALGVGRSEFYLPEMSEQEWSENYEQYSFWKGKGYLRAETIGLNDARISILKDKEDILAVQNLQVGEETQDVTYIPGYYCLAGMKLKLNSLESYDTYAQLKIDGEYYELKDGEKFLNNKCEIRSLQKQGINEKISIYCDVDEGEKNFELKIAPYVNLKINGQDEKIYSEGDILYELEDRNAFLGYIGETKDKKRFVIPVLTTDKNKDDFMNSVDKKIAESIGKSIEQESKATGISFVDSVIKWTKNTAGSSLDIANGFTRGSDYGSAVFEGETIKVDFASKTIKDSFSALWVLMKSKMPSTTVSVYEQYPDLNLNFVSFATPVDKKINNAFENYSSNAENDYLQIVNEYSGEKIEGTDDTYSEKDLIELIEMCDRTEQKKKMTSYCELFDKKYPNEFSKVKEICENDVLISNSEYSNIDILVDGKLMSFSFKGIREPSFDEYGAVISVSGADEGYNGERKVTKKQLIYLSENEFFEIEEIGEDYVKIKPQMQRESTGSVKINLNSYDVLTKKYKISVSEINLKKVAKVSVIPNIRYTQTKTNFTFKIAIEKRAIQLTPGQIQSRISNLDEQLGKWETISENLGKTVKGLKTACLGTGAFLTIKNFLADTKGTALARERVMRSDGGWNDYCANQVEVKKYSTLDSCLLDKSDEIDKDVETLTGIMNSQNEKIKSIQTYLDAPLGGKVVNEKKYVEDYSKIVVGNLPSNLNLNSTTLLKYLSVENYNAGNFYSDDLRDIDSYPQTLKSNTASEVLKTTTKNELETTLSRIEKNSKQAVETNSIINTIESSGKISNLGATYTENKNSKTAVYGKGITNAVYGEIPSGSPVQMIVYNSGKYLAELELLESGKYIIKNIFDTNGNSLSDEKLVSEIKKEYSYFQYFDEGTYKNEYLNAEIKYFESGEYKGYPAIVPFDVKNGWYAAVKSTFSGLGNIKAYDESGRVSSFWIGNVGSNGKQQFNEQNSDDIVMQFNPGTGEIYGTFPGLDESETKQKVQTAINAISTAQKAYKPGVTSVKVNGQSMKVGTAAVDVPEVQCSDFMSPKDCNLLFNVCDPVVCPSSRCNLGGNYYVEDVIQTGIIGGIALCLPNYREGIYMPVCLSGINAGVENLLSVVTSYRDCLQESLDTGKQVGVCDYINSIYLCEFLWREATPLAKSGIPSLLSWISGQNSRGGGEYMSFVSAYDNAVSSVDYFVNYYGANSYKAFKTRTSDEVGTEVCKNFISTRYPTSGDFIDALTTPDSPIQYTGWFEEIPFTTATNPPISQYKVFYHIYAGKDIGHYYKVYIKGSSGVALYQTNPTFMISQGYVGVGDYATETKDFTAPSNYKELCINIDGQDNCGFSQVTTSFASTYIKDKYVEEQTTQKITKEDDCISGTSSLYSLLNLNTEEGIADYLNSELSSVGIVRVCSSKNPGQGTNEERWANVGYCTDKNIGCWLDSQSVENAVKTENIEQGILDETTQSYLDDLRNTEGYYTEEEAQSAIRELRNAIGKEVWGDNINENILLENIGNINSAFEKVLLSNEKVQLLDLRARAYNKLARNIKKLFDEKKIEEQKTQEKTDNLITKTEAETEAEIDYYQSPPGQVYPIFEFKDGTIQKNLYFTYDDSNGWTWSPNKESQGPTYPLDEVNWRSTGNADTSEISLNENQLNLLSSLSKSETYRDGLSLLLAKTFTGEGSLWFNPKLSTDNIDFSNDEIFTLKQGIIFDNDIYFRYNKTNKDWEWTNSLTQDRWTSVSKAVLEYSSYKVNSAYTSSGFWESVRIEASGRAKELVTELDNFKGKSLIDGAEIIFSVNTLLESESVGSDRKNVDYNFETRDVSRMIQAINYAKENSIEKRTCLCGENCVSYARLLVDASSSNEIPDALLLLSLLMQESNCESSVSSDSSTGLMQINCNVHNGTFGLPSDRNECKQQLLSNPKLNIETGAKILKQYYDTYKKGKLFNGCSNIGVTYYNWEAALRSYNGWGCNSNYPQQDFYVDEVMARYNELNKLFASTEVSDVEKSETDNEKITSPEPAATDIGEITQGSGFSDTEIANVKSATSCSDCGNGLWNICDETECIVIAEKLNGDDISKYCSFNKRKCTNIDYSYSGEITQGGYRYEINNIKSATQCSDCGKGFFDTGFFNICDKNECISISEKIGRGCAFVEDERKCVDTGVTDASFNQGSNTQE